MSPETDRITVPTNGKRPHPKPQPDDLTSVADERPAGPVATAPFTPTQLSVGFAILAALIALAVGGLRRRSRAGRHGPFGRR